MKKINAVVKYFYPVTAGIETNMLETYSILAQKGWDVTIHTSNMTYSETNTLPEFETIRGLKIRRYKWGKFGFMPDIDWNSKSLLCLHNFDMFPHFQILLKVIYMKLLGRKKFSVVLIPHGGFSLDLAWSVYPKSQRFIKKNYNKLVGWRLINWAVDAIRAVSVWEGQDLLAKGINKGLINVIPNGIENEAYLDVDNLASKDIKEKIKSWGDYIVQVGRVYPIKNYETTIQALAELPKNIKFVIIGPIETNQHPEYFNNLEKLIKKLGLEDRVIFAGVIKGVDKYYAIKHARLMSHMAIWESFCNVVHEGMSQGLPCVVANNTALPLLIKNNINGFCVDTYDTKELAQKINFILSPKNKKAVAAMSMNNKKIALSESWVKVSKEIDKLYSKTANSKHA